MSDHSGFLRPYKCLIAKLYWQGMKKDFKKHVECPVRQQTKSSNLSPAGLLQPLPIPQQVWDDISIDFIEGLPFQMGIMSFMWFWTD